MKILVMLFCLIIATACATAETKPVKFVSEVKTSEGMQLGQTMEAMINAYNNRDIKKHVSYYASDAKIESLRAGGVVSRDQYESALLESAQNLPLIKLEVIKITTLSPDICRVEGSMLSSSPRGESLRPIIYDFIRREGKWFVIQQQYPK